MNEALLLRAVARTCDESGRPTAAQHLRALANACEAEFLDGRCESDFPVVDGHIRFPMVCPSCAHQFIGWIRVTRRNFTADEWRGIIKSLWPLGLFWGTLVLYWILEWLPST